MRSVALGDNWLRHVEDIANKHAVWLDATASDADRAARLCELNVVEQVANVCRTAIFAAPGTAATGSRVHGLVYGLADGLLRRVGGSVDGTQAWAER